MPRLGLTRVALALALALAACRSPGRENAMTEATALLGGDLRRIAPDGERREHYESLLAHAREAWSREKSEDAAIWVGRHLAYLGRYQESIEWYSARLDDFPASYRLLRHRGHRLISVRELARAEGDLAAAWALAKEFPDAIEPDGAPNRYGIPTSTTHTNILYHLALARYLRGDFRGAASAWSECLARCTNDDMSVATINWLYHALRRDQQYAEAASAVAMVSEDVAVIENVVYRDLCLLYAGKKTPSDVFGDRGDGVQDATASYGLASWMRCNGDRTGAVELLRWIVAETPWNAFGHIAAEADLAR